MAWRPESRTTHGILAVEHGQRIAEWAQRLSGAGVFGPQTISGMPWRAFGWHNVGGTSRGTASYFRTAAQMGFADLVGAAHVVHLRLNLHSNRTQTVAIGPATAVHNSIGGQPGNSYFAEATNLAGTPSVFIRKCEGGSVSALGGAPYLVREGDVLSLGYTTDGISEVSLTAFVNGVVVATASDTASPFDMLGQPGRCGLWGGDAPALSATVGHWSTEWWVTDGSDSFALLPPAPASLSGDLRCEIRTVQRYTDDLAHRLKFLLSGEVTEATWSFRRHGGCQAAQIEFRPQQDLVKNPDVVRYFEDPKDSDWQSNDWLGGLVVLSGRYSGFNLANNPAIDERLWTGRVTSCEVDRRSGVISLEAEGLMASLDELQFVGHFTGTIRDAIVHLVRDNLAKGQRADQWRATWLRYNAAKITGLGSALDFRIDMEFRWESFSSVLDRLIRLLPDGFVWGVDREGDFYLSYQQDNYEADMGASGGSLSIVTFDSADAERWSRKVDISDVRNQILVVGAEDPTGFDPSETILGRAVCVKSLELWGSRQDVVQENEAADYGIAAKMAQATCKLTCAPRMTAELTVTEPIRGLKSFWESLVAFAPTIAVRDRFVAENIQPTGMPRRAEFNLRRYGDEPAYSVAENGATGWIELPAIAADEMAASFLVHCSLRFTHAHPGAAGSWCFIFGRPGAAAVFKGWANLYWQKDTGNLWWSYEDASGASVSFNTLINVNVTTPANAVVHFTITRDAAGIFRAYNGAALTATSGVLAAPKTTTGTAWRWFRPLFASATTPPWRGELDQFWLFDGSVVVNGLDVGIGAQQAGGYPAFIARNNQQNLHRNEGIGLLAHAKFNEDVIESFSNGLGHKVWRASGPEPVGFGVAVRTTYTTGSSPVNGTAVTPTGHRGGHLIGRPKRWGGPLRLHVDSVTYELIPHSHRIRRKYSLGDSPEDMAGSVARVEEDVRTQAELLRRQEVP